MSIFNRMKTIAAADINEALDRMENPVAMLKQHLRELEQEIKKGEEALSKQLFFEKKLELLIADSAEMIGKRTQQARIAIEQQDEELAKIALEDKISLEQKLKGYQNQLSIIQNQTNQISAQVEQIKKTYEELKSKKWTLISRAHAAQFSQDSAEAALSLKPVGAISGYSRAEEKILELEAKAAVLNGLPNKPLAEKPDLYLQEQIKQELEKLKALNKA